MNVFNTDCLDQDGRIEVNPPNPLQGGIGEYFPKRGIGKWVNGASTIKLYALVLLMMLGFVLISNASAQDLLIASQKTNSIKRFDISTGAYIADFVSSGSGGLRNPTSVASGPDGNLYVVSSGTNSVKRYNGRTGAYLGDFVKGIHSPEIAKFGPDGNLYVSNKNGTKISGYHGRSGLYIKDVESKGLGKMSAIRDLIWNGDKLYVSSGESIKRYDRVNGAYIDDFAKVSGPGCITFGPDGNLYVSNLLTSKVDRFDGSTGKYSGVSADLNGKLSASMSQTWGYDGNLYVLSGSGEVNCFNGSTLEFMRTFIPKAGVDKPTGMVFRHSFGINWVRNRPFTLMTWLRHPTANTALYRGAGFTSLLSASSTLADLAFRNNWTRHNALWFDDLTQEAIEKIKSVSATDDDNAWYVWDEPGGKQLPGIAKVVDWLKSNRPNSMAYMTVANPDAKFLDQYMTTVKPDALMYDMYPFYVGARAVAHGPADIHEYITMLMLYRSKSLQYRVPLFSWMQTFESDAEQWRVASESELRMMAFSTLTAGAKGLGYFCYEPTAPGSTVVFEKATLKADLTPDSTYYNVQSLNSEILKLSPVLLQLESTDVRFIPGQTDGTMHNPYADQYGKITNWSTGAGGMDQLTSVCVDSGQSGANKDGMIGFFIDDAGRKYFMLTNLFCDPVLLPSETGIKFTLHFDDAVSKIYRLSRQTGMVEELILESDHTLHLKLPGGTGDMFSLDGFRSFPEMSAKS